MHGFVQKMRSFVLQCPKHDGGAGVFYIFIRAGLVELMAAKTCTRRRAIRLNAYALVEQATVVEFTQQPPQRLDIIVLEGDVGIIKINPVSHLAGNIVPLVFKTEYGFAAFLVIVGYGYFVAELILFTSTNIFFGNA